MRPPSRFRRVLLVALACLQVGAPAVVAAAEATSASRSAPRVHVEDRTHRSCVPVHGDNCALCQFLSHASALRASAPSLDAWSATRTSIADAGAVRASASQRTPGRSRAPPA